MKEDMHLGASAKMFIRAQMLRANETEAEKLLWSRLSRNQLGVKFRRQHPMLSCVVDFYCHPCKLVVELDGSVHDNPEEQFHDKTRSDGLTAYGLKVIRFSNQEVLSNLEKVVQTIKNHLTQI